MNDGGLWFSGAAASWLSEWDRAVFVACQPSYHLRQGNGGQWQLRAVLTVPVPGHSSPLLAALPAVAERSNLALAASAAGLLPAVDDPSGQDPDARPDDVRPASASSAASAADLPGQRPDTASGRPAGVGEFGVRQAPAHEDQHLAYAVLQPLLPEQVERSAAAATTPAARLILALAAVHATGSPGSPP